MAETNSIVRLAKGQVLFREKDDSQDLYIVKSGALRISKRQGSKEIVLDTLTPGMVAGEITTLDKNLRTATVTADEITEVIKIDKTAFAKIYGNIPDWFRKIATILVQRLREIDEKISRAGSVDHSSRVAAAVSLISYSDCSILTTDGFEMDLQFLENEVVSLLALPAGDVQAGFRVLEEKKWLTRNGSKAVLTDRASCELFASALLLNDEGTAATSADNLS